MTSPLSPISLDQVADRMEHLLLRYQELQKTNSLLQRQLQDMTQERDSLRSRLAAARARVDALLARLPTQGPVAATGGAAATATGTPSDAPASPSQPTRTTP